MTTSPQPSTSPHESAAGAKHRRTSSSTPAVNQKVAVVTGASSGIGEASARALAQDGWFVVAAARRLDRLEKLVEEIGGLAVQLDVTDDASVAAFAEKTLAGAGRVDLLVNNAGGARGLDPIAETTVEDWQWMYDVNVLGTLRVTKALRGALLEAKGLVIVMSSQAAINPYVGGGGYNAAKFAERAFTRVLRQEEVGNGLRVSEIQPGRVHTEEFSLNRFRGNQEAADAVYDGYINLTAEDIAETVRWVASLPDRVNIESIHVMAQDQA